MSETPDRDDSDVVGARIGAQIVDLFVIFFAILAVLIFSGLSGGAVGALTGGEGVEGLFFVGGILVGILVHLGYGFLLEGLWDGQTLGKRLVGIRVVKEDGSDIGLGAAFVRNIPAVATVSYFGVFAYAVALLSMAMSDKRQRLFDLLAGTVVVREGFGEEASVAEPASEGTFAEAESEA